MLAYKISSSTPDERDAAVLEFRASAAEARRVALRAARAVIELERTGAHLREGASSIAHFGEMNGVSAWETRQWVHLALAIAPRRPHPSAPEDAAPTLLEAFEATLGSSLEGHVAAGTIPVGSAAILGELVATQMALAPAAAPMIRPDDEWVELAKTKSTKELRRLFLERKDEVRAGQDVAPITAFVTNGAREDIDRARTLVSRSAHQVLTIGQTLGIVFSDWLDEHDPMRTTPGTRRLPDTSTIPDSRYVPAEVMRQVRARSRDSCIVPLCDRSLWVHGSHRVAHRHGGSREAHQLDLLCDWHHFLYEEGSIQISGPADAPMITDRNGRGVDRRTPWEFGIEGPPSTARTSAAAETPGAERPIGPGRVEPPPDAGGDPLPSPRPSEARSARLDRPEPQPTDGPLARSPGGVLSGENRELSIPTPPAAPTERPEPA